MCVWGGGGRRCGGRVGRSGHTIEMYVEIKLDRRKADKVFTSDQWLISDEQIVREKMVESRKRLTEEPHRLLQMGMPLGSKINMTASVPARPKKAGSC